MKAKPEKWKLLLAGLLFIHGVYSQPYLATCSHTSAITKDSTQNLIAHFWTYDSIGRIAFDSVASYGYPLPGQHSERYAYVNDAVIGTYQNGWTSDSQQVIEYDTLTVILKRDGLLTLTTITKTFISGDTRNTYTDSYTPFYRGDGSLYKVEQYIGEVQEPYTLLIDSIIIHDGNIIAYQVNNPGTEAQIRHCTYYPEKSSISLSNPTIKIFSLCLNPDGVVGGLDVQAFSRNLLKDNGLGRTFEYTFDSLGRVSSMLAHDFAGYQVVATGEEKKWPVVIRTSFDYK